MTVETDELEIKKLLGKRIRVDNLDVVIENQISKKKNTIVYLASDIRGKSYALKAIQSPNDSEFRNSIQECKIYQEVSLETNIISIFGIGFFSKARVAIILMELAQYSLKEYMKNKAKEMTEKKIIEIFQSICTGVHSLHIQDNPIAHMCLTASNILYSHGVWKITDFGSSTSIDSDSINYDSISKKLCPPEILLGNEVDSLKVDIWQLGCLLYKMCTQKSPFKGKTESEIIHAECAIPENLNSQMTELIKFCLNPDPRCRPTIIGVLSKTHLLFPAYTDPRHCHPPKPNCSTEILSLPHSPHPPLPSFPPPGSKVTSASLNQIPRLQRRQHVSYNRINRFKRLSESQLNEINSQVNRLNNLLPPVNVEEILDRIMNDRDNLVNELLNSTPNDFNNTLNLECNSHLKKLKDFSFVFFIPAKQRSLLCSPMLQFFMMNMHKMHGTHESKLTESSQCSKAISHCISSNDIASKTTLRWLDLLQSALKLSTSSKTMSTSSSRCCLMTHALILRTKHFLVIRLSLTSLANSFQRT